MKKFNKNTILVFNPHSHTRMQCTMPRSSRFPNSSISVRRKSQVMQNGTEMADLTISVSFYPQSLVRNSPVGILNDCSSLQYNHALHMISIKSK